MHPISFGISLRTLAALASLAAACFAEATEGGMARDLEPRADAVRIPNATHALGLRRALTRASRTLAKAECQRIFREFSDEAGRPLQETLDAEAKSGEAYLASLLFYDGSAHPRCRSQHTFAVTRPGNRVVLVCTTQFTELTERKPRLAAAVLIHEQLHALGLGENPPTSSEITARVMMRCAP
jgi:hypothetical protein